MHTRNHTKIIKSLNIYIYIYSTLYVKKDSCTSSIFNALACKALIYFVLTIVQQVIFINVNNPTLS